MSHPILSRLFIFSWCALCFSACQDDEDATDRHGQKDSNVEHCYPAAFQSACVDDGKAATVCELTNKGFVAGKQACSAHQSCIEYDGKAECVDKCTEEGEILSEACAQVEEGAVSQNPVVQKIVCTRFEDGQLYAIRENTPCSDVCYRGKCAKLGDPCDEKKQDKGLILGCHGSDLYVCDEYSTIRKEVCQKNGLCQVAERDGESFYYCADTCTKSGAGHVCAVGQIAAVSTKCIEVSEDQSYRLNVVSDGISTANASYCEDGVLKELPHSTCCAGKINCIEECYGNVALTRFDQDRIYEDCTIGKCGINQEWGFHECMQPCEKEGEQIMRCGAFGYEEEGAATLFECIRFDQGLFYRSEQIYACASGCRNDVCQ